jgi:cytochrome c peroxidase
MTRRVLGLVVLGLLAGCDQVDMDAPWTEAERALIASLSPLPDAPGSSPGNAWADRDAAAKLGHRLFFDTRLSANGGVACATCHVPDLYFTDARQAAVGVAKGEKNTPTVLGAGELPFVFWDGRKDSVWAQALGPLESELEHGVDRTHIARIIREHHREAYVAAFGALPEALEGASGDALPEHARPVPLGSTHPHQRAWDGLPQATRDAITEVFVFAGKALEAYQRKLTLPPAPFDRYVAALADGDASGGGHLDASARRGLRWFIGRGQCVNCHNGPWLTDAGFHNLGLPLSIGESGVPMGRTRGADEVKNDEFRCGSRWSDLQGCEELRFLDPRFEDFMGAFKTPTLRNVAETGPWMHGGHFETLADVVAFYRDRPGGPLVGHRDLLLEQIDDDLDIDDVVAFLQTLTSPRPDSPWWRAPKAEANP